MQEKTAVALEEYKKWLKEDLLPRSDGDFRLGMDKFRKKLRFALASDLSVEELMKRAQADLAATQTAIYETALPLYKKYFPNADEATLSDKKKVTTAVLDKLAEQHPDDNTIVATVEKTVTETTDFVRKKNLVRVPDKPLEGHRDAGVQARAGDRLLRFTRPAGEKRRDVLRVRADAERLDEGAEGIVLPRVQQLHGARPDRA